MAKGKVRHPGIEPGWKGWYCQKGSTEGSQTSAGTGVEVSHEESDMSERWRGAIELWQAQRCRASLDCVHVSVSTCIRWATREVSANGPTGACVSEPRAPRKWWTTCCYFFSISTICQPPCDTA
eukprot:1778959-Prymnesium_polylepis.1